MPVRFSWLLAFALLIGWSGACAPLRYGSQEIWLNHGAGADTLRLGIFYDAIEAEPQDNSDGQAIGARFATRVGQGQRVFFICDWPLFFDIDKLSKQSSAEAAASSDELALWERDLLAHLMAWKVPDHGYYDDAQSRLGLYQRLEIPGASRLVALFDRGLHLYINQQVAKGEFEHAAPWLDDRSRELWLAMARERRSWLSLKDGVLAVDLPMTSACASKILAGITQGSADKPKDARFFAGLFSHLSELRIADDHLVLRWKLDGPTWTFQAKDPSYDDALASSLRKSGAVPGSLPSREAIAGTLQHGKW